MISRRTLVLVLAVTVGAVAAYGGSGGRAPAGVVAGGPGGPRVLTVEPAPAFAPVSWRLRGEVRPRPVDVLPSPEPSRTPVPSQTSPPSDPPPESGPIDWVAIAECESGGRWHIDGTYDGGLQFHPDTWTSAGGGRYARFAWQATPAQQIATAERWVDMVGCYWCSAGWPYCGRFG